MRLLTHTIPAGSLECPACNEAHLERRNAHGTYLHTRHALHPNGSLSVRIPEDVELPVCSVYERAYPGAEDAETAEALLERIWEVRLRERWGARIFHDDELSLGVAWSPAHGMKSFHVFLLGLGIKIAPMPGDEPRVRVWSYPTPQSLWENLRGDGKDRSPPLESEWFAGIFPWDAIPLRGRMKRLHVPEYFGLGVSLYLGRWTPRAMFATLFLGPWKLRAGRWVWSAPPRRKRRRLPVQSA